MTLGVQCHCRPIGERRLHPDLMDPVLNDDFARTKPVAGGFWTSTFAWDGYITLEPYQRIIRRYGRPYEVTTIETRRSYGGWLGWMREEQWGGRQQHLWTLSPDARARVRVIDTYHDLLELHREYEKDAILTNTITRELGGPDYYRYTGLDFEAMARDFDALHLTDEGQWATRWPGGSIFAPVIEARDLPDLYGWDCESTLWFRWMFTDWSYEGAVEVYTEDENRPSREELVALLSKTEQLG